MVCQMKLNTALKFTEVMILGYMAYYLAVNGSNSNIYFVITMSLLVFGSILIGAFNKNENLELIVKYFYCQMNFRSGDDVRIAIHKKANHSSYRQYIDLYPSGGKKGKKYSTNKGIVRHGFENAIGEFSECYQDDNDKKTKLVEKYNYNMEEAKNQLFDGEWSYYCCPITLDNKVWGVLYMSSKKHNMFPMQENLEGSDFSNSVKVLVRMIEYEIS